MIEKPKRVSKKEKTAAKQDYIATEMEIIQTRPYEPDEYIAAVKELEGITDKDELPFKVERFCNEYVIHYNEEKAAQEAGWPIWNAAMFGRRLLTIPRVKREIENRQKKITKKLQITQERVLTEIASIAYCNLQDYYDEEGVLKPIHKLTREQAAAIQDIVYDRKGNPKNYRLIQKNYGLDALSKNLGLFDKDAERTLPVDFKQFLALLPQDVQDNIRVSLAKRIGGNK
ncbi:MAG: terminase small subunit [Candidatus Doudnabacteria bacterium]